MITAIERFTDIVNKQGQLTLRGAEYLEELTRIVNLNTPLTGTGSPEGVITAEISQRYMDTAGAAGSVLYIKQSGAGSTGWKLV